MYNPTATGHVSPMHYTIQADYLCITKTILASVSHQYISTRPVQPQTTLQHIYTHTHTHTYIYIYIYIQVSTILGARASAHGLCFALRFASAKSSTSRTSCVKAPDFAFAKLHACKAKQQPNRNPQLDYQNLTGALSTPSPMKQGIERTYLVRWSTHVKIAL